MRILVLAGYGGHAGYALALVYELWRAGATLDIAIPKGFEWIGERFKGLGRVYYLTLPRKPGEALYKTLNRWPQALAEALHVNPSAYDAVVATGSNFSLLPTIIHRLAGRRQAYTLEDVGRISSASKTVRILYTLGATTFLHWAEQKRLYPRGVVVGPIFEPRLYSVRDEGYILVTTGTWGLPSLYTALSRLGVDNVVVQTGDVDPEKVSRLNSRWRVFKYTADIHKWISGASIVVTHFPGTTAVTARLAYGKPVVLVYSPRHKHLAPVGDGRIMAGKLGAVLVEEITPEDLAEALEKAPKIPVPSHPNGSKRAVEYIMKSL